MFQFSHRLVVNYNRVSILVANLPDDKTAPDEAGRMRDNIAILAETAEALCETVDMRIESMSRAEQLQIALAGAVNAVEALRKGYVDTLVMTDRQLHELVDEVEKTYSWLETSQAQEQAISSTMQVSVRRILALLAEHGDVDKLFEKVLETLRGSSDRNNMEFF
jgi:ClpP class serine protease